MGEGIAIKSPSLRVGFVAAVFHPIFGGVIIGFLAFVTPLFYPPPGDHAYYMNFWTTVVVAEWTIVTIILASLLFSVARMTDIGLQQPRFSVLMPLVVFAAVLAVAIGTMSAHSLRNVPILPWTQRDRWFSLLVISPTAAVCEEIIYRGVLLHFLLTSIGFWPAAVAQALMFGFMHGGIFQTPGWFAFRTSAGLLFALLVRWRGNLGGAMSTHFIFDAVSAAFAP